MGFPKIIILTVIVVGVAVFMSLDRFQEDREQILKLLNTSPLHWFKSPGSTKPGEIYNVISEPSDELFTKDELAEYHGGDGSKGLYLGILGRVYDVEKGSRFYGEGNGYGFFRARDGTKAFMTGEFNEEGLIDDATGLRPAQMLELEDWIKFYDKDYTYKGKLVGNFYNAKGEPTDALYDVVERIKEAHDEKAKREELKKKFPPCNSSYKQDIGQKRLWCTDKSGGVQRDWVGVPRQMFTPGKEQSKCVCVRTEGTPSDDPDAKTNRGDLDNPSLKEYDGCDPLSQECLFAV